VEQCYTYVNCQCIFVLKNLQKNLQFCCDHVAFSSMQHYSMEFDYGLEYEIIFFCNTSTFCLKSSNLGLESGTNVFPRF
jgi:hypothetical protein